MLSANYPHLSGQAALAEQPTRPGLRPRHKRSERQA